MQQKKLQSFGEAKMTTYHCTCPDEGLCKHIGAVLICYMNNPYSFAETLGLEAQLRRKTKDELVGMLI